MNDQPSLPTATQMFASGCFRVAGERVRLEQVLSPAILAEIDRIGRQVRRVRLAQGENRSEFAARTGIAPSDLLALENGAADLDQIGWMLAQLDQRFQTDLLSAHRKRLRTVSIEFTQPSHDPD